MCWLCEKMFWGAGLRAKQESRVHVHPAHVLVVVLVYLMLMHQQVRSWPAASYVQLTCPTTGCVHGAAAAGQHACQPACKGRFLVAPNSIQPMLLFRVLPETST